MNLKEAIIGYVGKFRIVDQIVLIDALELSCPEVTTHDKLQAISELVMDKTINCYEYRLEDRAVRFQFYTTNEVKLVF